MAKYAKYHPFGWCKSAIFEITERRGENLRLTFPEDKRFRFIVHEKFATVLNDDECADLASSLATA